METDPKPLAAALCRDLLTLFGRTRIDVGDDGRLLPILAPAELWRVLPKIMRKTCDLAESLTPRTPEVLGDTAMIRDIAEAIEVGRDARRGKAVAR